VRRKVNLGRKILSDLKLQVQMMSTKLPFNEAPRKCCGYAWMIQTVCVFSLLREIIWSLVIESIFECLRLIKSRFNPDLIQIHTQILCFPLKIDQIKSDVQIHWENFHYLTDALFRTHDLCDLSHWQFRNQNWELKIKNAKCKIQNAKSKSKAKD
jgi:hypothetical protein